MGKIIFFISVIFSLFSYAQEEPTPTVEEPTVESEEAIESLDPLADEEDVLNQLEQLNEVSESNLEFTAFIYSERGRKNPFQKPGSLERGTDLQGFDETDSTGLEGYDISSFQLTAILWDVKYPKALVKASEEEVYVIEEGTKIGRRNGYVAKIREGEVVIIEPSIQKSKNSPTLYKTQVLKLGR